ncbi:uncharacterized protein LOC121049516 [Rosa chinensis]|uniref:uncharacterized protein LOC121049516 n=1 Tax=Rosa chinensis TaxID=74649 RepID=UPI001AD8EFFE|nr:uncharacterized protein LOC121049516 [Rosa chinensis]XP_040363060.1 uncharacterized protein LOC121049516 [Rosa chinensis]
MDQWSYGWEDPRGYEQESFYGGGHQVWNSHAIGSMSSCNETCALCNSPWHSSFECSLRFECPDFMQECEYKMGMYQETFIPNTYPQEEAYEPSKEFVDRLLAQLHASQALLQASQVSISQETMVSEAYPHEQAYESRKPSLEELLAQLQASQAQLQASQAQLQASQEILIHTNEQLETSLAQEPPFTIYDHESFFDQVQPISREEVYIEHLEQESFMQVENDDSDVDVQEIEVGYESFNASGVRDYTSEEPVQYWKSNLHNEEEVYEVDSEEEDSLSSEEDVELEDLHHDPLIVEVDIPKEKESPSIPCDELPKVDCRILSTYILNERIEIKVLLPLNPPLSGQCFYNEVMDWKGSEPLALNLSHHSQELLPPIVPMSIISNPLEKEKARLAPRRKSEKRGKTKKLHFWPPIGVFLGSSWSCLYDTSRSPLAPNNRVVALEKYPP